MNCGKILIHESNESFKRIIILAPTMANESKPIVIMGAGLSGLAASIILAKGGERLSFMISEKILVLDLMVIFKV